MSGPSFLEKWRQASSDRQSLLCVGLDPELERLPKPLQGGGPEALVRFCREIVEATLPYACAYKPNLAFFEALGPQGWSLLREILAAIPSEVPVIADAKRGDIGHTARAYAVAIFEQLGCDAVTVQPYLGYDGVQPFLAYREKLAFILCRTSNPGARDFQDLLVRSSAAGAGGEETPDSQLTPLYLAVAERVCQWQERHGNCGLVAGATYPRELAAIRERCPTLPLLVPGVGAQGGELEAAVRAGLDQDGGGILIAVSRAILYADGGSDYALAAGEAARRLRNAINQARGS
ncbi:MAG: orotidine-5'-phosphate decarboxylase [Thermogemmatispora sp.]|uniref:orotidine-5'-phosphate decarboxylase n=1 Tax=Thermogemmatispora sp. TaxID=1968838 RepID=UPI002639ABEA|nr:orotidine-5'-phosphate decarboxylase [Thermogemmatispora sp.]MBX5457129.1 orotidine-5'-phosphate decarboxylase [Thermogemmatispora sp.]